MKKYDITTVKKAIEDSAGYFTQIAKKLGCEWHTAEKYVNMYPEAIQMLKNEREKKLDLAEFKLLENIKDNDNTAIIFYLKTQGKHRGYIEKQEIEQTGNDNLGVIIVRNEKAKKILEKLRAKK